MKIKTPFLNLEIEYIFIIIILICIFSCTFREYISAYFICYLFILFHELSHMFVASIFGKEIDSFKFSVSGVNIKFKEESYFIKKNISKNFKEILIYLAGPFSNIFLAFIFKNNIMISQINIFLAIINLFPIYPLDGYNILRNTFINFFEYKKCNFISDIISAVIFGILLFVGLFQIILYKNPSILIFLVYIYIINECQKKDRKYREMFLHSIC